MLRNRAPLREFSPGRPPDALLEPWPRRAHLIEITNAEPRRSNVQKTAKLPKSRRPRARSRETARRSARSRRISAILGPIDGARRRRRDGRGAAAPGPRPGEASCKNRPPRPVAEPRDAPGTSAAAMPAMKTPRSRKTPRRVRRDDGAERRRTVQKSRKSVAIAANGARFRGTARAAVGISAVSPFSGRWSSGARRSWFL